MAPNMTTGWSLERWRRASRGNTVRRSVAWKRKSDFGVFALPNIVVARFVFPVKRTLRALCFCPMLREYARVTALKQKPQPVSGKNGQRLNIFRGDAAHGREAGQQLSVE